MYRRFPRPRGDRPPPRHYRRVALWLPPHAGINPVIVACVYVMSRFLRPRGDRPSAQRTSCASQLEQSKMPKVGTSKATELGDGQKKAVSFQERGFQQSASETALRVIWPRFPWASRRR